MALGTIDRYGAPQYGPIGRPPAGMVFHTPEWGDTPALYFAIACAEWQATPANTSGGSYHGIIGHEGSDNMATCTTPDHWIMVRSVGWDKAAGGLTSNHTPPPTGVWAPDRFPWIRQLLSPEAFADPNRWLHQISLGGAAAWYNANGYPKGLVIRLAEWVLTLEKAYGYDSVMTMHRMWQTNRGDSGPLDLPDLIMVEYDKLVNPTPPEPTPPPIHQTFVDVGPDSIHFASVEWAAANGIASVPADRRFRPKDPTTREESVTFIKRLFDLWELNNG